MKLQSKFFIWMTALISVVVIGGGAFQTLSERRFLKKEMDNHNQQVVKQLARVCEESLYQNDLALLNYMKTLKQERGFVGACFIDTEGMIRLHSDPKRIGRLESPDTNTVLVLSEPVLFSGSNVGNAQLFLDKNTLQNFLNESLRNSLKRIGVVMMVSLFLGFLGAFWLARNMVKPIQQIVSGMREVSHGRRDPLPLPARKDEIGMMGQELNLTIEKLRELDEMKRDFVAGVTHDLRSPLSAIGSFAHMMLHESKENISAAHKNFLLTIQNNAQRLMRLVDDLLTTARLESRHEEFERTQFDMNEVVEEIHKLYWPLSQEKGLHLKAEVPKEEAYVWGDREKVIHVMHNLVSNAFKFTSQGSVSMRVEKKDGTVQVKVADTGAGISADEKVKIFSKFYRSPSTAKKVKGTGLGLAIVKGLVEGQGGQILVEDNPGRGTIFIFTLPT